MYYYNLSMGAWNAASVVVWSEIRRRKASLSIQGDQQEDEEKTIDS